MGNYACIYNLGLSDHCVCAKITKIGSSCFELLKKNQSTFFEKQWYTFYIGLPEQMNGSGWG